MRVDSGSIRRCLPAALLGVLLLGGASASAQDDGKRKDIVLQGDAACTRCHDEGEAYPVLSIGKTKHGTVADERTPTCTSCHGESPTHISKPEGVSRRPSPDVDYVKGSKTPIEQRNQACLNCHQGGKRIHWQTNLHAARDVACTSCHQVHVQHDKVRDKQTQSEVCFSCHKEQRAQINRPSRHPIKEGKVACSDCHNPHGTAGEKMMVRDSVVETCYTCHMEKRGPFVRSHQPVTEDCSICHNPHGTVNDNLLKQRAPFLCQQCHEPATHQGTVAAITGDSPFTLARGCVNCHTQIHGSNNPSTADGRGLRR